MKTLTSLLLLAVVAVPASAQFPNGTQTMPGTTQNVMPAPGNNPQYNLTPSVVNGQVTPSVTYPQQYSTYNTGGQVVGGSVLTNGSIPRPYATNGTMQSNSDTLMLNGSSYARGGDGVYYPQSQLGSATSQPMMSGTTYAQPTFNGTAYSQPQNFGTTYNRPYTPYSNTTNSGGMMGSQNGFLRQTTGFVGNVARAPLRIVRGVLR